MMPQLVELRQIYNDIHQCAECCNWPGCKIKPDPEKVPRVVIPNMLASKIFLAGQALARGQQRLSGIPYTYPSGRLSTAGTRLSNHLTKIGYCIPHPGNDRRQMVYSSDIIQCWPGSKGSGNGDIKPDDPEVSNCFPWLLKEIELVKPRVIILLGKIAASVFFHRYLDHNVKGLAELVGREKRCIINELEVYLYVLPHPAGAYLDFASIYSDTFRRVKLRLDSL